MSGNETTEPRTSEKFGRSRKIAGPAARTGGRTLVVGSALFMAHAAEARVVQFIVDSKQEIAETSKSPAYFILSGHYKGSLDPTSRHNKIITDIQRAERDVNGSITYDATFSIALPKDPRRDSGFLWYDVPNRGNGTVTGSAKGDIQVVSGWQGDIAPQTGRQVVSVPIAIRRDGQPITGRVLQRFTEFPIGSVSLPIVGGQGFPNQRPLASSLDTRKASLTYQKSERSPATPIKPADWAFADCSRTPFPGTPSPAMICLREGFKAGTAYTLVYEGKDPKVLGIGFAAVRDLTAFLKYAEHDDVGAANPIARRVRWAIATGTSQSGNFLRSFVHLGFNQAETGKIVFDGMNPNIAARQLPANVRFGVPAGAADTYEQGSEGTTWWGSYNDRTRKHGLSSLLDRCASTNTCPKIIETFGSAELWGLRMSLDLIGTDARQDIALPANVRRYYFPSTTHGGSRVGGFPVKGEARPNYPGVPFCTLPFNPAESEPNRRALLQRLADWVALDREPPASRFPSLAAGDLVTASAAAVGWPAIPGMPTPDNKLNELPNYDFGPGFDANDLSGIAMQPPRVGSTLPQRVARVNRDGNEAVGVPSIQLLVPIGTYTGWNVLAKGYGAGGPCGFAGGFIPFARTEAQRSAAGDPRPSLEERYGSHDNFVRHVRAAVLDQIRLGWLLAEDGDRIITQAETSEVLR